MSRYYRSFLEESTIPYTTRTTAFASATGITDTTILGALNTFDLGLISNGLDTKMKALYPFVGGTASTHKYNFMDARDLDAAFRLTFNGGWVHSSNGVLGNGTNTYMNTFLIPSTVYADFKTSGFGVYSRTNETGDVAEGSEALGGSGVNALYPRILTFADYYVCGKETTGTVADSLGLTVGSQISATNRRLYRNGTKIATTTGTIGTTIPSVNMYFGAINGGTAAHNIGAKSYAFAFHCENMTDTDQTNLYTLTQAFQTTLSRQV